MATTTINASGVTFPDNTTQSTAASAVTTSVVLNATAGASAGAVGAYHMMQTYTTTWSGVLAAGSTMAGSNLRYASTYFAGDTFASGTWRLMGSLLAESANGPSVWLRIS